MKKRRNLRFGAGDHFTLLNVYRKWTNVGRCGRKWCDDNFVYFQTMESAKKLMDQLRRQLELLQVPSKSCGNQYERVQAALAATFANKAASLGKFGGYVWLADKPERLEQKAKVTISTDSDLLHERRPLVICYKVVVAGERKMPQMELVTEVEKHMLPDDVREIVPNKKPWTPGDALMKAWRESENAATSPAIAHREFSLAQ